MCATVFTPPFQTVRLTEPFIVFHLNVPSEAGLPVSTCTANEIAALGDGKVSDARLGEDNYGTLKIAYLELPTQQLAASKTFYANLFGWTFQNYGRTTPHSPAAAPTAG